MAGHKPRFLKVNQGDIKVNKGDFFTPPLCTPKKNTRPPGASACNASGGPFSDVEVPGIQRSKGHNSTRIFR
jgi:hypothetical protein